MDFSSGAVFSFSRNGTIRSVLKELIKALDVLKLDIDPAHPRSDPLSGV
jgi:hypothetical protein